MTTATHTLLTEVLDAHGGIDRWHQFSKVRSIVVSGGFLWGMKGIPLDDTPRAITSEFRRQWTRVEPFGQADWHMLYEPTRVVIETQAGEAVAQQDNPRETFAGHAWETPVDATATGVLQRVRDVDLLQPSVSPRRTRYRGDSDPIDRGWRFGAARTARPLSTGDPFTFVGTELVLRRHRSAAQARLRSRCCRTRACRSSHLRLRRCARAVVPHATSRLHAKCGRHSPVRQDAGLHRSV